jgi:hypothetical protein
MRILEQVVAASASPSIGYAAYDPATREYPGRVVVLRHQDRIMSRWDEEREGFTGARALFQPRAA